MKKLESWILFIVLFCLCLSSYNVFMAQFLYLMTRELFSYIYGQYEYTCRTGHFFQFPLSKMNILNLKKKLLQTALPLNRFLSTNEPTVFLAASGSYQMLPFRLLAHNFLKNETDENLLVLTF